MERLGILVGRWVTIVAIVVVAIACGQDSGERSLSVAPASTDLHPVLQSLRDRQKIVYRLDPTPDDPASGDETEKQSAIEFLLFPTEDFRMESYPSGVDAGGATDPFNSHLGKIDATFGGEFFDVVAEECNRRRWLRKYPQAPNSPTVFERITCSDPEFSGASNACARYACSIEQHICTMNLLNEVASARRPTSLSYHYDPTPDAGTDEHDTTVIVPVQSPESRARLQETALALGATLFAGVGVVFPTEITASPAAQASCDVRMDATDSSSPRIGTQVGVFLREMNELVEESARKAAASYVAIADSDRGRFASLSDATESQRVIRGYAANLLAGGHVTLESIASGGCGVGALDERARAALEILRSVGLPYSVLKETASIDDVIRGSSPSRVDVQYRYPRITGRDVVKYDAMSRQQFLDDLGLDAASFDAARNYLVGEVEAFGRGVSEEDVSDQTIPNVELGASAQIYTATSTPPAPAPWTHYSSTLATGSDAFRYLSYPITLRDSVQTLEELFGRLRTTLAPYVGSKPGLAALMTEVERGSTAVRGVLRGIAAYSIEDRTPTRPMRVLVATEDETTSLVVVTDLAAVRCAVEGAIEGRACTWDQLAVVEPPSGVGDTASSATAVRALLTDVLHYPAFDATSFMWGYIPLRIEGSAWTRAGVWEIPASAGRKFFVLRLKPGSPANIPGSYEQLIGLEARYVDDDSTVDVEEPVRGIYGIAPSIHAEAAELIRPSTIECSEPAVSCNGMTFSAAIPLEDELIEDGSTTENSWQIYLRRARDVAERADLLGTEVVERSLDIEQRAEGAVQELQDICGVEVDIDPFVSVPAGTDPVQALVTPGGPLASIGVTERERLHRCLAGDSSTLVRAAFGSEPLCGWTYHDEFCAVDPATLSTDTVPACPYPAPEQVAPGQSGCAVDPDGSGTNYEPTYVADTLQLLPRTDPAYRNTAPTSNPGLCTKIRELRHTMESTPSTPLSIADLSAQWKAVFEGSGFFNPESLSRAAANIGVETGPGNYATLLIRGRPIRSTGNFFTGPSAVGLCSNAAPEDESGWASLGAGCRSRESGLFCSYQSCADASSRAVFNARLISAATVARWFGGIGLGGFVLPDEHDVPSAKSRVREYLSSEASGLPNLRSIAMNDEGWTQDGPTIYCFDQTNQLDGLWTFARQSADMEAHELIPNTRSGGCADGYGIRFARVESGFWGYRSTSTKMVNAHLLRSEGMLERLSAVRFRSVVGPTQNVPGFGFGISAHGGGGDDLYLLDASTGLSVLRPWNVPTTAWTATDSQNAMNLPWMDANEKDGGRQTHPGVGVYFGHEQAVPQRALMDAFELLCEAGVGDATPMLNDAEVTTKAAAEKAAREIERFAGELQASLATMTIDELPRDVVRDIQGLDATGAAPRGQYGAQLLRVSASIKSMSTAQERFQQSVDSLGRAFRRLSENYEIADSERGINRASFRSTISSQVTRCITTGISASGMGNLLQPQRWALAAVTCADAAVQIAFAGKILKEQLDISQSKEALALIDFNESMSAAIAQLRDTAATLRASRDELQASLHELSVVRDRGRRALAKAMFLDSDATGMVFRTNTVSRARLNLSQVRYERAREDAVAAAFIAKRAIEQRFGVRLATMNEDLQLVAAPATWESSLCTADGVDYEALRSGSTLGSESEVVSSMFIGDYVTLLENFVESYRFDYPIQDGRSTAVISLRDDVQNVRAYCERPIGNALTHSGTLDARAEVSSVGAGWSAFGCDEDSSGDPFPFCTSVRPSSVTTIPGLGSDPHPDASNLIGTARAFSVRFGGFEGQGCPGPGCDCDDIDCGWANGVTFGQDVDLAGGTTRVSWYAPTNAIGNPSTFDPLDASEIVAPVGDQAVELVVDGVTHTYASVGSLRRGAQALATGWSRYWFLVETPFPVRARFQVVPRRVSGVDISGSTTLVAGPMVEPLSGRVVGAPAPGLFLETSESLTHRLPVCEDETGATFRDRGWTKRCESVCDEGIGATCSTTALRTVCFWETSFSISERAILRGEMLARAGFALGNFNYRVEDISVNFVGTGARRCEDEELPSTCYSAGYINYSLQHLGRHQFRNYDGELVDSSLFPATIQHALGLASERYITNPISSADRALIEPYAQRQFRGRPISGDYVLRVWEGPGVNFRGIEDVQILLNYRYWTRAR